MWLQAGARTRAWDSRCQEPLKARGALAIHTHPTAATCQPRAPPLHTHTHAYTPAHAGSARAGAAGSPRPDRAACGVGGQAAGAGEAAAGAVRGPHGGESGAAAGAGAVLMARGGGGRGRAGALEGGDLLAGRWARETGLLEGVSDLWFWARAHLQMLCTICTMKVGCTASVNGKIDQAQRLTAGRGNDRNGHHLKRKPG